MATDKQRIAVALLCRELTGFLIHLKLKNTRLLRVALRTLADVCEKGWMSLGKDELKGTFDEMDKIIDKHWEADEVQSLKTTDSVG